MPESAFATAAAAINECGRVATSLADFDRLRSLVDSAEQQYRARLADQAEPQPPPEHLVMDHHGQLGQAIQRQGADTQEEPLHSGQQTGWLFSDAVSGLIFGKTTRFHVRKCAVSCVRLRDAVAGAEPIQFEFGVGWRAVVAAGWKHTVCVSAEGEVFSWGSGNAGCLGLGDTESKLEPVQVRGVLEGRAVA